MSDFVWDPSAYAQYAGHRARPFQDLVAAVEAENPRTVVDVGCGPGNMTLTLARRWPHAEIIGLDSSPEMIQRANTAQQEALTAGEAVGNVSFQQANAAEWKPSAHTDVVISNAMLQWIPTHRELIREWLHELGEGAWFAMQVPGNHEAASHTTITELAAEPEYAEAAKGLYLQEAVYSPQQYSHTLIEASFRTNVWESTYYQLLTGENPVFDWVKGAALRPVLSGLAIMDRRDGTTKQAEFIARYKERMHQAYPAVETPEGTVATIFPMRRIFVVGQKTWDYFI